MITTDLRGVVMSCSACNRRNRTPFGRVGRCGQCGEALPPVATPLEIPDAGVFDAVIASSALPVVVDFWAPWCGPCRAVAPELARVAEQQAGRWLIVKVNTEALPEIGARFDIRSIPTMAVFQSGQESARTSGARPAAQIAEFVEQATDDGRAGA